MISVPSRSPHYNGELCPTRINADLLPDRLKAQDVQASKTVHMYNLDGEYIKTFRSMKNAQKEMNVSSHMIVVSCNGYLSKNARQLWSFEKCEILKLKPRNVSKKGTVQQYTKKGKLVAEYKTLREASEKTGAEYKSISACITGNQKTTSGYIWKRKS